MPPRLLKVGSTKLESWEQNLVSSRAEISPKSGKGELEITKYFKKCKWGLWNWRAWNGGSPERKNGLKKWVLRVAHTRTTFQCECSLSVVYKNWCSIKTLNSVWNKVLKNIVLVITLLQSRKFKGEICCGGHLAVTYGGKLLYLWIFHS